MKAPDRYRFEDNYILLLNNLKTVKGAGNRQSRSLSAPDTMLRTSLINSCNVLYFLHHYYSYQAFNRSWMPFSTRSRNNNPSHWRQNIGPPAVEEAVRRPKTAAPMAHGDYSSSILLRLHPSGASRQALVYCRSWRLRIPAYVWLLAFQWSIFLILLAGPMPEKSGLGT